ncbi:hypothetical protein [Acinetobacter baumannii]|uniref:hypothetical protein n=1 Tax=Acinetobacter baumannii TaxID=470 RepID=UPI000B1045CF
MPKFLIIAEKVYKKLEEDKLFSDNLIEQLNNLVSIRPLAKVVIASSSDLPVQRLS